MFTLYITFVLNSLNTAELILPTLRLTQPQQSRGYAALTNHLKLRLLSTFDKSLAKKRLKIEANDGKKKAESHLFSSEPLRHAVRSQLSEMRSE